MTKYEFNYWKIRKKWFPAIPIIIADIETFALIDSGASVSIFRPHIARDIGIDIESGDRIILGGIGSKIIAYVHDVLVVVEDYKFNCRVAFSEEYTVSFNLLGRDNFFEQFLITFDEAHRKLKLEIAE